VIDGEMDGCADGRRDGEKVGEITETQNGRWGWTPGVTGTFRIDRIEIPM